jgi:hypothetical protein
MSTETNIHLKAEISCMIEKLPCDVLEMDLVADQRVNMLSINSEINGFLLALYFIISLSYLVFSFLLVLIAVVF